MQEPTRPGWLRRPRGAAERGLLAGGRLLERLGPDSVTWRGATLGLALGVLVLFGVHAGWLLEVTGGERGSLFSVLALGVLIVFVGPALSVLAWLVERLVLKPARTVPVAYRWAAASALFAVSFALTLGSTRRGMVIIVLLFIASTSLVGAGCQFTFARGSRAAVGSRTSPFARVLGVAALLGGLLLSGWQVAWLAGDGPGQARRRSLAAVGADSVLKLALTNSGRSGSLPLP